jgi:hypothetical protein
VRPRHSYVLHEKDILSPKFYGTSSRIRPTTRENLIVGWRSPQRLAFFGPRFTPVRHFICSLALLVHRRRPSTAYGGGGSFSFYSVISDNAVSWFDIFGLGIFISKIDILSKFDAYALV